MIESGFSKKNNQWKKGGKVLSFEWKLSNNKAAIEIVNLIKEEFERFGIKIKVTVQEWGTFMKNIKKGRFDIMMGQWIGFTGPDMMKFIWHSKSIPPNGANRGHYINTEFDKLLDESDNYLG